MEALGNNNWFYDNICNYGVYQEDLIEMFEKNYVLAVYHFINRVLSTHLIDLRVCSLHQHQSYNTGLSKLACRKVCRFTLLYTCTISDLIIAENSYNWDCWHCHKIFDIQRIINPSFVSSWNTTYTIQIKSIVQHHYWLYPSTYIHLSWLV